jgi:polyhydroxyalkanoate synthase
VQSLINPPGNPKACYYTNDDRPETADEWWVGAAQQQGSWWPLWMGWLQQRSNKLKARPRRLGNSKYPAGAAAPGEYVHEQAD